MKKSILISILSLLLIKNCYSQNKLNLNQGQKLHQTTITNAVITQTVNGNEIEMKNDVTLEVSITIDKVDTAISTTNAINRMKFHALVMGNSSDFDSDKKEDMDGQIGQMLKNVFGKSYTTVFSLEGKLIKSDAANVFAANVSDLIGQNFDELPKESFLAVPKSLKAGDSFTQTTETDKYNSSKIIFTVQSVNGNIAVLSFTGKEKVKKSKNVQGMDAVISAESSISGTLSVDIKTGMIKEKKMITETKGTTEVMGQQIPLVSKVNAVITTN